MSVKRILRIRLVKTINLWRQVKVSKVISIYIFRDHLKSVVLAAGKDHVVNDLHAGDRLLMG